MSPTLKHIQSSSGPHHRKQWDHKSFGNSPFSFSSKHPFESNWIRRWRSILPLYFQATPHPQWVPCFGQSGMYRQVLLTPNKMLFYQSMRKQKYAPNPPVDTAHTSIQTFKTMVGPLHKNYTDQAILTVQSATIKHITKENIKQSPAQTKQENVHRSNG